MRILHSIPMVFLSLLVGCSTFTMKFTAWQNENHFLINEDALSEGILRIHLPSQHPKNFSIETPNGDWFVLQDSQANIELMPQAQFDSSTRIELVLADIKGTTWRSSVRAEEIIFKISGKYKIYFADNLETEPENTFSFMQEITFIQTPR